MFRESNKLLALAVTAAITVPGAAFATNGMLMEGYGPIATGMGGASMAYDNGTAAMMNNPATLGLMADGSRLDLAAGHLAPDVTLDAFGSSYSSKADSFYMPAIGWVKKDGAMAYGVGLFAQGGMGVDFQNVNLPVQMGGPGDLYSQVSVGRLIAPFAYNVNEQLSVGATLDYVWANLDLQYGNMFEFRDSSDFSGEAKGDGIAFKLGVHYKLNEQFNVGGTYHSKGNIGDLTGASGTAGGLPNTFTFEGFDMPAVVALGATFQANDKLLLAADYKQIQWSGVMTTPTLVFGTPVDFDGPGPGPAMPAMPFAQNWDDQNVISLGAAYQFNDAVTGRIGANIADNPIPGETLNPLFPAIVENHYMVGVGYNVNKAQSVDFSLTYAPEASASGTSTDNVWVTEMTHSQTNWQLMYSHRF